MPRKKADPGFGHGQLRLLLLPGRYALCRLDPCQDIPDWAIRERSFVSLTYTADELSIVCPERDVPPQVECDRGWAVLKVRGPLDLSLTGVLDSLAAPLAREGIPLFVVSTFDTDYLLVKARQLTEARMALERAGHKFE